EALVAARAARRVFVAHGEAVLVARIDMNTGYIHGQEGRYGAALRCFARALARHRERGDAGRLGVARCLMNRGLAFTRLGRYAEGWGELELARRTFEEMGEHAEQARTMRSIGENRMEAGHYTAALRAFEEARPLYRALGLAGIVALAR